jgi:hypothetical protein
VPGLAEAFRRPAITVDLALSRMNGTVISTRAVIPDELSALVLEVMAWRTRRAEKDAVDIWRSTEVGLVAGVMATDITGKTGDIVRDELRRAC